MLRRLKSLFFNLVSDPANSSLSITGRRNGRGRHGDGRATVPSSPSPRRIPVPRRVWLGNGFVDEPDRSLFRGWTPVPIHRLSVLGYKWSRGQWVIFATAPGIVVGGCFSPPLGVGLRANGGVGAATAEPRPCDRPAAFLRSAGASPAARCCREAAASGVTGSKFPSSRHAKKCMRAARATF